MLDGSEQILLDDYSGMASLSKFMFRHGLGGGKAWVAAIDRQSPALIHAHFFNDGLDAVELGEQLDHSSS